MSLHFVRPQFFPLDVKELMECIVCLVRCGIPNILFQQYQKPEKTWKKTETKAECYLSPLDFWFVFWNELLFLNESFQVAGKGK